MSKRRLSAILWRRMNDATFATLAGNSTGQFDIRLTIDPGINEFFKGIHKEDTTPLGGYTLRVPIEPFDGTDPISQQTLDVRYMGADSARKDWNIPSQRPDTAYPLWRRGRGAPQDFKNSPYEFVLLAKDVDGRYHARWIKEDTFKNLPAKLQKHFLDSEVGVLIWEAESQDEGN